MSIKFISPKKSVNSAFLKLPVPVEKMKDFKLSLKNLYSKRNTAQDEEYHKGEIWNFLRKIFVVGSAYSSGDFYPSTEQRYFDVVSGFNANVHGFPCEDSYVLDRVRQRKLRYMGELQ